MSDDFLGKSLHPLKLCCDWQLLQNPHCEWQQNLMAKTWCETNDGQLVPQDKEHHLISKARQHAVLERDPLTRCCFSEGKAQMWRGCPSNHVQRGVLITCNILHNMGVSWSISTPERGQLKHFPCNLGERKCAASRSESNCQSRFFLKAVKWLHPFKTTQGETGI